MGFLGELAPLSIRWALYKNQCLVSALPYLDIGVIAEFDEGDPFVNTVSSQWPLAARLQATRTKVFLTVRSTGMLPSPHRLLGKGPGALPTVSCPGLVARTVSC